MSPKEEERPLSAVEQRIDRCCPGFLRRIEAASGKEVIGVIYDNLEDSGTVPPRGVIFADYSHATPELVGRCIDEATEVPTDLPPAAGQ